MKSVLKSYKAMLLAGALLVSGVAAAAWVSICINNSCLHCNTVTGFCVVCNKSCRPLEDPK